MILKWVQSMNKEMKYHELSINRSLCSKNFITSLHLYAICVFNELGCFRLVYVNIYSVDQSTHLHLSSSSSSSSFITTTTTTTIIIIIIIIVVVVVVNFIVI